MKILLTAIALGFAVPAAAQPAAQPQQQHQQHQQGTPHGQHQGQGHSCACCADRNNNGRMDCCERMGQPAQPSAGGSTQPQGNHSH
ncbi:MAG: hypothetical protein ACT4OE_00320 [Sphingosinicella sp.]